MSHEEHTLTTFERGLLNALADDGQVSHEEVNGLSVASRWFSGAGSFTEFVLPEAAMQASEQIISDSGISITISGRRHAAGCLLYKRDGHLSTVEIYGLGTELDSNYMLLPHAFEAESSDQSSSTGGLAQPARAKRAQP